MEKRENEMPHLIIKSGLEVDLDYVLIAKNRLQVVHMQKCKSGCRAQRRQCQG